MPGSLPVTQFNGVHHWPKIIFMRYSLWENLNILKPLGSNLDWFLFSKSVVLLECCENYLDTGVNCMSPHRLKLCKRIHFKVLTLMAQKNSNCKPISWKSAAFLTLSVLQKKGFVLDQHKARYVLHNTKVCPHIHPLLCARGSCCQRTEGPFFHS